MESELLEIFEVKVVFGDQIYTACVPCDPMPSYFCYVMSAFEEISIADPWGIVSCGIVAKAFYACEG